MDYQLNFSDNFTKRMFIAMTVIQLLLISIFAFLSIIINKPAHTFNLDSESNIPAWYSSIQLFMIGIVLLAGNMKFDSMSKSTGIFIKMVGLGFIFLSLDETAQFHEAIGRMIKGHKNIWTLIYAAAGILLLFWGWKAIKELYKNFTPEMKTIIAGFSLMVLGSVVLEKLGYDLIPRNGQFEVLYKIEVILEEYLEMLGASLIFLGASRALVKCSWLKNINQGEIKERIMYFASGEK